MLFFVGLRRAALKATNSSKLCKVQQQHQRDNVIMGISYLFTCFTHLPSGVFCVCAGPKQYELFKFCKITTRMVCHYSMTFENTHTQGRCVQYITFGESVQQVEPCLIVPKHLELFL